MRSTLVILASILVAVCAKDECPPCKVDSCSSPNCPAGQVFPGPCPCCPVCALMEGESCYNSSIPSLKKPTEGITTCGENLVCLLRNDLGPHDSPEALCTCIQTEQVCGSDGQTYETICQMATAVFKGRQDLTMLSWGPCKSAPEITSAPEDASGPLHQGLALDCEAKGFPIPDLHWEFKGDDGQIKNLPSDDLYVAVQVRGGPEAYMVSSWVQIVDLRPTDTGVYTCVATNSEGTTRSSAKVGVYKGKQRRMARRH